MSSITSLLDKFEKVQVTAVSMISDSDKSACEALQAQYDEAIHFHTLYMTFLNEHSPEGNKYVDAPRLKNENEKRIDGINEGFILQVVYYFQNQYQVSLSTSGMSERLKNPLRYEDIVQDIAAQMDGMNFYEKAVADLKTRLLNHLGRWTHPEVKGVKVSIQHYLHFDDRWSTKGESELHYSYRESLHDLVTAISHFENGATSAHHDLEQLGDIFYRGGPNTELFRVFDFSYKNKFQSFRPFKNSKVELKFVDAETALAFAKNYLDYRGE